MKLLTTTLAIALLVPVQLDEAPVPETSSITYTEPIPEVAEFDPPEILEPIRAERHWPGDLKRICSCESTGRPGNEPIQFNPDGTLLRGKINPRDVGMCQINLDYHGMAAVQLGFDLFTEDGNHGYAVHLYSSQGSTPWNWSRHCWDPSPLPS